MGAFPHEYELGDRKKSDPSGKPAVPWYGDPTLDALVVGELPGVEFVTRMRGTDPGKAYLATLVELDDDQVEAAQTAYADWTPTDPPQEP